MNKKQRADLLRLALLDNWLPLKSLVQELCVPAQAAPEIVALIVTGHSQSSLVNNSNNRINQAAAALRKLRPRDVHRALSELALALSELRTHDGSQHLVDSAIERWEAFSDAYDRAIQERAPEPILALSVAANRAIATDEHLADFAEWMEEPPIVELRPGQRIVSITIDALPTVRDAAGWLAAIDGLFTKPESDLSAQRDKILGQSPLLLSIESGSLPVKVELSGNSDWLTKVIEILEKVLERRWRSSTAEGRLQAGIDHVRQLKDLGIDTSSADEKLLARVVENAERLAAEADSVGAHISIDGRRIEPKISTWPLLSSSASSAIVKVESKSLPPPDDPSAS